MSESGNSDYSFGWNDTGEDTMSSSEEGNVSTASSVLDRKAHKKKLRQELGMGINDVKKNGPEGSEDHDFEISAKKKKKEKIKRERELIFINTLDDELPQVKPEPDDRPKKSKIKFEPDESTIQSSHKKSKKKTRLKQPESEEAEITDVKEEESESSSKKKKNKKRKLYSADHQSIDETKYEDTPMTKKRRINNSIDVNDTVSELLNGHAQGDPSIENSTKSKERTSFSTNTAEIKLSGRRSVSISSNVSCKMSTSSVASSHNDSQPSTDIRRPITSVTDVNRQIDSRKSFPLTNKKSSFSERIQFEEEIPTQDDSDKESTHLQKYSTSGKKIEKFLNRNPHLTNLKLSNVSSAPITKDDEVWILKCPKDLNHISLTDSKISLEDRTKLKVDGQTYEGYMQKESSRIAVLFASSTNTCEIRDVHPKGILTLRKRIPKVPINENSIAIPNETFIPLPETKPRHPLFGPDYRKMIKIPAAVAKRLVDTTPKKLSSKRKHKIASMRDEAVEGLKDVAADAVDGYTKKKKKKRKFSETVSDDVPVKKERKKFKYDPEVWNSEKSIEQSLFDF